jgi:hypothetical protein
MVTLMEIVMILVKFNIFNILKYLKYMSNFGLLKQTNTLNLPSTFFMYAKNDSIFLSDENPKLEFYKTINSWKQSTKESIGLIKITSDPFHHEP